MQKYFDAGKTGVQILLPAECVEGCRSMEQRADTTADRIRGFFLIESVFPGWAQMHPTWDLF